MGDLAPPSSSSEPHPRGDHDAASPPFSMGTAAAAGAVAEPPVLAISPARLRTLSPGSKPFLQSCGERKGQRGGEGRREQGKGGE